MRIIISIIALLMTALSLAGGGNATDSLEKALSRTESPEEKIEILFQLSKLTWASTPEKTEKYLLDAVELAESLGALNGKGRTYVTTAFFYEDIGKIDKALEFHYKALDVSKKMGNPERIAGQYNNLGILFKNMGNFEKALELYYKSYEASKSDTVRSNYISTLINIANLLNNIKQSDESIKTFHETAEIAIEYDLPKKLALIYANMSSAFLFDKQRDSAIYYGLRSYEINDSLEKLIIEQPGVYSEKFNMDLNDAREQKHFLSIALIDSYLAHNETGKAEELIYENINWFEKAGNVRQLSRSYKTLSDLYAAKGDDKSRIEALKKSIELSVEAQNKFNAYRVYYDLYEAYKKTGKYDSALTAYEKYSAFNDSLRGKDLTNALAEQRVLLGLENAEARNVKLKNENLQKELEKKNAQNLNNILLLVTLFLLLVIFVFMFLYRKIKSLNVELRELNATKDKFFSIIAHDLKNPISAFHSLSGMMHEDYDILNEEERRKYISILKDSSKNVFELLENLLVWSETQRNKIVPSITEVHPDLLLPNIESELKIMSENKNIRLIIDTPVGIKIESDPNLLKIILTNLAINSIKFTPAGGKVTIGFKQINSQHIFQVADTGVGMTQEKLASLFKVEKTKSTNGTNGEKGTGLGLIIVKEFTGLLGGEIKVESEPGKGTVVFIILS